MSLDWHQTDHSVQSEKLKGRKTYEEQISQAALKDSVVCVQILWLHPTIAHFGRPSCTQLYTNFGPTSLQWVIEYAENIKDLHGSKECSEVWALLCNPCQRLERNQFRKYHANMPSFQDYLWRDLFNQGDVSFNVFDKGQCFGLLVRPRRIPTLQFFLTLS